MRSIGLNEQTNDEERSATHTQGNAPKTINDNHIKNNHNILETHVRRHLVIVPPHIRIPQLFAYKTMFDEFVHFARGQYVCVEI